MVVAASADKNSDEEILKKRVRENLKYLEVSRKT